MGGPPASGSAKSGGRQPVVVGHSWQRPAGPGKTTIVPQADGRPGRNRCPRPALHSGAELTLRPAAVAVQELAVDPISMLGQEKPNEVRGVGGPKQRQFLGVDQHLSEEHWHVGESSASVTSTARHATAATPCDTATDLRREPRGRGTRRRATDRFACGTVSIGLGGRRPEHANCRTGWPNETSNGVARGSACGDRATLRGGGHPSRCPDGLAGIKLQNGSHRLFGSVRRCLDHRRGSAVASTDRLGANRFRGVREDAVPA